MNTATAPKTGSPDAAIFTGNRLVAYNIWRLRRARGWTQDECMTRYVEFTGRKPFASRAAWAMWERWRTYDFRTHKFDADELVGLSRFFGVPFSTLMESPSGPVCPHCGLPI